ncbi:MAG TPA: MBL fold metallo-hydrolase [Myxococcaceae bacterium]|nr:MBL fold metallo-hydrolase [Myxococcaceae bacterium]
MTKHLRFASLLLLLSTPAFAQFGDFNKATIKVHKVGGSVYMLELVDAAGGNIGVSVGEDGIVLVDDQWAPLAPKIREALKTLTDKPVKFVINTHHHADHTNGNIAFGTEAPVIAHDNVRKRLEAQGIDFNNPPTKAPKHALPLITFDNKLSVHLNGEEIRAIHYPNGHTDGDSIIWFTRSKVVHMGDDAVMGAFPYIDLQGGGSIKGITAALDRAVKELPADVKIIPGHGPLTDVEGLKQYSATLKEITAVVEAAIKSGKTAEEAKKANLLTKWEKLSHGYVGNDMLIDMLYADLGRTVKAPPGKAKAPGQQKK